MATPAKEGEIKEPPQTFTELLQAVMRDPNYFVSVQPEGQNWSNWHGINHKAESTWVWQEKAFLVPVTEGQPLTVRIIATNPREYHFNKQPYRTGTSYTLGIHYVIDGKTGDGAPLPILFICQDTRGKEVIARRNFSPPDTHDIPQEIVPLIQDIIRHLGSTVTSALPSESPEDSWSLFLQNVLRQKTAIPSFDTLPEELIRESVIDLAETYEAEPYEIRPLMNERPLSPKHTALGLLHYTEQKLLSYAYADIII